MDSNFTVAKAMTAVTVSAPAIGSSTSSGSNSNSLVASSPSPNPPAPSSTTISSTPVVSVTSLDSNDATVAWLSWIVAGASVAVLAWPLLKHFVPLLLGSSSGSSHKNTATKRHHGRGSHIEDSINVDALMALAQANNVGLRKSATKIMLERAAEDEHLAYIVWAVKQTGDVALRIKGSRVLGMLAHEEPHRKRLLKFGALQAVAVALANALNDKANMQRENEEDDKAKALPHEISDLATSSVMIIADLLSDSDGAKQTAVTEGVLDSLLVIFKDNQAQHDLVYWGLVVFQQLVLLLDVHDDILRTGLLDHLVDVMLHYNGFVHIQRMCLNAFVTLLTNIVSHEDSVKQLERLLKPSLNEMITRAQQSEDVELIYWTIGLLHEFATKEIGRVELAQIPTLPTVFGFLLANNDTTVQKVVLRTVAFLSQGNDEFQDRLIEFDIISKLLQCLKSSHSEVAYWSLVLIHNMCLLRNDEGIDVDDLAPFLELFLRLCDSDDRVQCICAANIIYAICDKRGNHDLVLASDIFDAVNVLVRSPHGDVRSHGVTILYRLLTWSEHFPRKMFQLYNEGPLPELCLETEVVEVGAVAAKCAIVLAIRVPQAVMPIYEGIVEPLVHSIIALSESYDDQCMPTLCTSMSMLGMFLQGAWIGLEPSDEWTASALKVNKDLGYLQRLALDHPFSSYGLIRKISELADTSDIDVIKSVVAICLEKGSFTRILEALVSLLGLPATTPPPEDNSGRSADAKSQWRSELVAASSAHVLCAFCSQRVAIDYVKERRVVSTLLSRLDAIMNLDTLDGDNDSHQQYLLSSILTALDKIVRSYTPSDLKSDPKLPVIVMRVQHEFGLTKSIRSTAASILDYLFVNIVASAEPQTPAFQMSHEKTFQLDIDNCSEHASVTKDGFSVSNKAWTLETALCNFPAPSSGLHMFEVTMHSDRLIQVGWSSSWSVFDGELFIGVGDSKGTFCCFENNFVDIPRKAITSGDVLGCTWDADAGKLEFFLNGEQLPRVVENVGLIKNQRVLMSLYPAVSLHSNEQATFNFGGQPFSFPIQGFRGLQRNLPTRVENETSDVPTASNTIIPAPLKTLSPSMYFEVSFPCPQRTTDWLEIGFVQTGKEGQFYGFYFEFESASIYISTPTEPKVLLCNEHVGYFLEPHTFGVGICYPEGIVLLTRDGITQQYMIKMPRADPFMYPHINGESIASVNYGQRPFEYGQMNKTEARLGFVRFMSLMLL